MYKVISNFLNKLYKIDLLNWLCFFLIVLYLLPYLLLQENSHIQIHDYLDSNLVWLKVLAESGKIFASSFETLPNFANGLPRIVLGSEFDLQLWLSYLLGPFKAFVFSQLSMRILAFYGMKWLLLSFFTQKMSASENQSVVKTSSELPLSRGLGGKINEASDGFADAPKEISFEQKLCVYGSALCFALLPFWPAGGLSVAGQPLVLYCFLQIKNYKAKPLDWFFLCLIPFFSYFVLSYFFFLLLLSIYFVFVCFQIKKFHWPFFLSICLFSLLFVLIEHRLFELLLLGSKIEFHRLEFVQHQKTLLESLKMSWDNLVFGQEHTLSMQNPFLIFSVLLALGLVFGLVFKHKDLAKTTKTKIFLFLILALVLISLIYGSWYWQGLQALTQQFSLLDAVSFNRFYFLQPFIWYLAFFFALSITSEGIRNFQNSFQDTITLPTSSNGASEETPSIRNEQVAPAYRRPYQGEALKLLPVGKYLVICLLFGQILYLFYNHSELQGRIKHQPTYKEFFAVSVFSQIKKIVQDSRLVSVGIHPAVAQFNGLYTLDHYLPLYSLEYKHKFRQIIEQEMAKDEKLKKYFDQWGNRCYVFSTELQGNAQVTKGSGIRLQNLSLNTKALKEMNGRFVISAVPIDNAKQLDLSLLGVFDSSDSAWKVYLYEVAL